MDRRTFMGGAALLALPAELIASKPPASGVVGLICSADGIAGVIAEGERGDALDPSWRWHIGSNTKAMTAALYGRMVDTGKCRWDADIASLFPSVSVHESWTGITVEDLLCHSSGLTDDLVDAPWLDARRSDPKAPRTQRHILASQILAEPRPASRGTYRYGNLNYVLVGHAIEEATDTSWEEAMQAHLFAPLGIVDAGFGAPKTRAPWGRMTAPDGFDPVDPMGVADNPAVLWPSGGVHLTAMGYGEFLSLFLRTGAPLLKPETFTKLLQPAHPDLRYAGGWSLEGPEGAYADSLAHNGSNTFWFASAMVDREEAYGIAAISNAGGDHGLSSTVQLLKKLVAAKP